MRPEDLQQRGQHMCFQGAAVVTGSDQQVRMPVEDVERGNGAHAFISAHESLSRRSNPPADEDPGHADKRYSQPSLRLTRAAGWAVECQLDRRILGQHDKDGS